MIDIRKKLPENVPTMSSDNFAEIDTQIQFLSRRIVTEYPEDLCFYRELKDYIDRYFDCDFRKIRYSNDILSTCIHCVDMYLRDMYPTWDDPIEGYIDLRDYLIGCVHTFCAYVAPITFQCRTLTAWDTADTVKNASTTRYCHWIWGYIFKDLRDF
jgi:hypothetical protein